MWRYLTVVTQKLLGHQSQTQCIMCEEDTNELDLPHSVNIGKILR